MRAAAIVLLLVCTRPAYAQEREFWPNFLPRIHYFQPLIADPLEPRMAIGLVKTDVFEHAGAGAERQPFSFPDPEDSSSDVQAAAAIGGSIPLLHLAEWPGKGGIVASAQIGVFARFRIEYPSRDDTGQDWFVGMPFEIAYDKFTGRFRIMHRSSHIGDELVEVTGAQRIEFGGEFADFVAGYEVLPGARLYGGGTWNFRSYTARLPALIARGGRDRFALQGGIDGSWYLWSAGKTGVIAGLDWQSAERIGWKSQLSFAGGITARTNERSTRLLLRYFHGPSSMGEFFLTPETFVALEWVLEF